jgi:hypothetical protein
MTLITKLNSAFTDTTLPKLVKDPVIVDGTRLLVDMKSIVTWPSQASSITTSSSLFNCVDNSWPTLSVRGTHTYSPSRGGLQGNNSGDGTSGLWLSDTSTNIINDATKSWVFTIWLYRGASTGGTLTLLEDQAMGLTSVGTGGPIVLNAFGANGTANSMYLVGANYSVRKRLGFTVYQDGSFVWKFRQVEDQSVGAETNLAGATNTNGGAGLRVSASGTTRPRVFPVPGGYSGIPTDYLFYRIFAENLSVSGRTYQQALDADWARGDGRFS